MTGRLSAAWFSALLLLAWSWLAPARADALRVCLAENIPPLSWKDADKAEGFDLLVARAVAQRLGRTLIVQWFESKADSDNNSAQQADALLSDGHCQLVGGYPLFAGALGEPMAERSRLPDYEGAKPEDRRRWVRLDTMVASRAYRFAPLAVVLGPSLAGRDIGSLGDLKSLRLGVEEGTLADAILMTYGGHMLVDRIQHVVPGRGLFERLERGDYDATLVELHRLDAYRARHPESKVSSSGHYHSIGFNIGFVGLASEAPLMSEVNAAIDDMLAKSEMPALAKEAGLTYLPPRQPDVLAAISHEKLRGD